MYAARPGILELTGKESLDDAYFTQILLPNYVEEHPEECANWDVIWDARGHLKEPHTDRTVPLGTLEVRSYLSERPLPPQISINSASQFPTVGPENRFKNILFIEKEGFDPLLERVRIAERFDLAPISTKGLSVIAARRALDSLATRGVETVFVLHDFDIWGFSIAGTLGTDSRRYRYENRVRIVDLGLRLADVEAMALQSEPVAIKPGEWDKRVKTLIRHGATRAEIDFLRNRRVELNAMTSPQFVEFIEQKLREHGITKVIPDKAILEQHWRFLRAQRAAIAAFEEIRETCITEAEGAAVPEDLIKRVTEILAANPSLSWDEALQLVEESEQ